MINILKSQGEPGKVREKISKILQVMEESGRFFDKADKPIFRFFLLKLKSKMCVPCFLHDRLLFICDLFFNILIIGVLIVSCVLYLIFFFQNIAVFRAALHIDVALAQFFVFCVTLVFCISRVDMKFIAGMKLFCLQMLVS